MKNLFRILKYVKGYKNYAFFNVFFNLVSTIFSFFSITMIIPFLDLIFQQSETKYLEYIEQGEPLFSFSVAYLQNSFNYYLSAQFLAHEGGKLDALVFLCVLISSMVFFKNIFRYLALYAVAPLRYGIMSDLRNNLYRKIVELPLSYFSEEKKGDILSKISNDVQEIEWNVLQSLEMLFRDPITIIIFLLAMVFWSPQLTLFVFVFLPISGVIIGRIGRSLKQTSAEGQSKLGQLLALAEETLSNIRIIQAFNGEKKSIARFENGNTTYTHLMVKMQRKRDLASPVSEFLGVSVLVVILWFGGKMIIDQSDATMSASTLIAYIALFSQIITPAKALTTAYFNIQKAAASEERINEILDTDIIIKDSLNAEKIDVFKEKIEFRNISFSYTKTTILSNINFSLFKGQTIALVGESGGGKSTLADLLPRFYDPIQGEVTIDGKNIKQLKIKGVRALMGVVTQDSILFNDTVANNISFGLETVNNDQIIEAAKIANAHQFIEQLEGGYNFNIGDGGNKLSGGQKQRLSIARAILKNPPILILDEATSALDTESEQLVQEALNSLMKNRTTLVIAHRLSTIQNADEIIVIDKGRIAERGTHTELIIKNGIYQKLSDLQSFS